MTTKKAAFPGELIGKRMEIIHSSNKNEVGITGRIVDETKSTFRVEKESKQEGKDGQYKTLFKKNITFRLGESGRIIVGRELVKRPEERIKG